MPPKSGSQNSAQRKSAYLPPIDKLLSAPGISTWADTQLITPLVYWHEQIWTKSEEQFRPDESVFCRNPAGFQEKAAKYGRNWAGS
jgi:hypothetical protein